MDKMMKFLKIGLMALFLTVFVAPNVSYSQEMTAPRDHTYVNTTNYQSGVVVGDVSPSDANTVESASASQGSGGSAKDIFTILQRKLYNTLVDLRKIVYVIAGFGLIVFAVAAIFNKISYKHLGYIMVGLSLLSLMFPFLEYFSGYTLEDAQQKQLTFKNYMDASDYSAIRGTLDSDILNPKGEGQTGDDEMDAILRQIEEEDAELERQMLAEINKELADPLKDTMNIAGQEVNSKDVAKMLQAGCGMSSAQSKSKWDESGTRNICTINSDGSVTVTQESCQGKVKDGVCKKTTGQTLQDIWGTVADTIQFGMNAGTAFNNTIGSIIDTGAAFNNMGDVMNSDMGFFDKINALSSLTANTWGSNGAVTRDLNSIIGGLMGMAGNMGNSANRWSTDYENNPSGSNVFSDIMKTLGGYGESVGNTITQAGGYVSTGAHMGNEIHTQANNINAMLDRFGGNGSTLWDRWKGVFGK